MSVHIVTKSFLINLAEKKHVEYVHGNKRLSCSLCDDSFASKQALVYHINSVHKKTSPVKCDKCSKTFASLISMKNHKKFVHSNQPKSKCFFCDAQFKQKKDLNFHIRNKHQVNTSDHFMNEWNDPEERKRFQCKSCDANYKYKKDLGTHKNKHHGGIDSQINKSPSDSIFKCDLCSLS